MYYYHIILTLIVLLSSGFVLGKQRIHLTGKELLRGKVIGAGYSVTAKSLAQCIETCNQRAATCDGVIFHEIIGKCRLVKKCVPALQIDNSTSAVYYSRRPLVKSPGYYHDAVSDTCMGLVAITADYAEADKACAAQNGKLVLLTSRRKNDMAMRILQKSEMDWAWIEEKNSPRQAKEKSGNSVSKKADFAPDVIEWRNDSIRSCWAVNYNGEWGEFTCKNHAFPALCEIGAFPL